MVGWELLILFLRLLPLFFTLLLAFLFVVLVAVLLIAIRLLLVSPLILLAVVVRHLLLHRFIVLCQGFFLVFLLAIRLRVCVLDDLVVAPEVPEDFALNTFALSLLLLATLFFYWVLFLVIFFVKRLGILLFFNLKSPLFHGNALLNFLELRLIQSNVFKISHSALFGPSTHF